MSGGQETVARYRAAVLVSADTPPERLAFIRLFGDNGKAGRLPAVGSGRVVPGPDQESMPCRRPETFLMHVVQCRFLAIIALGVLLAC